MYGIPALCICSEVSSRRGRDGWEWEQPAPARIRPPSPLWGSGHRAVGGRLAGTARGTAIEVVVVVVVVVDVVEFYISI